MFRQIALFVLGLIAASSALACRVDSDCGANGSCVRANPSDTYGQCVVTQQDEPPGDTAPPPGETSPNDPRMPVTVPDADTNRSTGSGAATTPGSGQHPSPASVQQPGRTNDGVVAPLPPNITEMLESGNVPVNPSAVQRPPPDDGARWERLNDLMAVPGAQPGDDDVSDDDGAGGDDNDEGSDSDGLSGSWYDPSETGNGFVMPGPDSNDDAQRPTVEDLMEPYLRYFEPETLRTPCDDCELIAQEIRGRISEIRATRERRFELARERMDAGNAVSEAERTVAHIRSRIRHYEIEIERLRDELVWERSKVRNEERVREVEDELRRLEWLKTSMAGEMPDAERAVREAQQAFEAAEASEFGFLRKEVRLRGEIADLLRELWECEREKCGIIRDVDYGDDYAPPSDAGAPDDPDVAREIGRILDEGREEMQQTDDQ